MKFQRRCCARSLAVKYAVQTTTTTRLACSQTIAYNLCECFERCLCVCFQAYYRRAQALEQLNEFECCVADFITSYELQPQTGTFYRALKIAETQGIEVYQSNLLINISTGVPMCGMSVTTVHLNVMEESGINRTPDTHRYSHKDLRRLTERALKQREFGILPILKFMLKAELNSIDIVREIKRADEAYEMVHNLSGHSDHLLKMHKSLTEVRVMGAELVRSAIKEKKMQLVDLFLESLEIEGGIIDISDLMERTRLRHKPQWLSKMFQRGADLEKCKTNPMELVLGKTYYNPAVKLEMIQLLIENRATIPNSSPCSSIINEVVDCTLKCENGTVDILELVCARFDFETKQACDIDGRNPWHVALQHKQKKMFEKVCKVLRKYPIDPNQTDKKGKRPDYGEKEQKEQDARAKMFREMEVEPSGGAKGGKTTPKRQREQMKTPSGATVYQPAIGGDSIKSTEMNPETEGCEKRYDPTTLAVRPQETREVRNSTIETSSEEETDLFANGETSTEEDADVYPTSAVGTETPNTKPSNSDSEASPETSCESENSDHELWDIQPTKKVIKTLNKNKGIVRSVTAKMKMLSKGEFVGNPRHCKSVTRTKGAELYESHLCKKKRLIWQIVPRLLPGHTGTYQQFIKVWAIVLDHSKIHSTVQKILGDKGFRASEKLRPKLKCISNKLKVHKNKRAPQKFVAASDETEDESNSEQ